MNTEESKLECRGDTILQETFKKYSLVSTNPRELLRVTGSKAAGERYWRDFQREMFVNNFCVNQEEEGFRLRATIAQFIELGLTALDLE